MFNSWLFCCHIVTLGKLLTHCLTHGVIWYQPKASSSEAENAMLGYHDFAKPKVTDGFIAIVTCAGCLLCKL